MHHCHFGIDFTTAAADDDEDGNNDLGGVCGVVKVKRAGTFMMSE